MFNPFGWLKKSKPLKEGESIFPTFEITVPMPKVSPPGSKLADRQTVYRKCEKCDRSHECRETFRDMVDRAVIERDGSVILFVRGI